MFRSFWTLAGFVFSATVLAATGAAWAVSAFFQQPEWLNTLLPVALWLGFAAGAGVFLLTAYSTYLYHRYTSASDSVAGLLNMVEKLQDRRDELEAQVELLSAVRDISTIVNDQTLFKESLERIARVFARYTGCGEIALFATGLDADKLVPRMHFREGKARFDKKIDRKLIDDSQVAAAFEEGRLFTAVESGELSFSMPLVSEMERVGVVKVFFQLPDGTQERLALIEKKEYLVKNVARHLALPLKTSHLYDRATIDASTGLYTKRHFLDRLAGANRLAKSSGRKLSLIMLDIDHFKNVNDTHGHQFGDYVLAGISGRVQRTLRASDSAYRYGGEEIAIILEQADAAKAYEIAERLRVNIEARKFRSGGTTFGVTISLGVAELVEGVAGPKSLVERADRALYASKEGGRNRVTAWAEKLGERRNYSAPPRRKPGVGKSKTPKVPAD